MTELQEIVDVHIYFSSLFGASLLFRINFLILEDITCV